MAEHLGDGHGVDVGVGLVDQHVAPLPGLDEGDAGQGVDHRVEGVVLVGQRALPRSLVRHDDARVNEGRRRLVGEGDDGEVKPLRALFLAPRGVERRAGEAPFQNRADGGRQRRHHRALGGEHVSPCGVHLAEAQVGVHERDRLGEDVQRGRQGGGHGGARFSVAFGGSSFMSYPRRLRPEIPRAGLTSDMVGEASGSRGALSHSRTLAHRQ